MEEYTIVDIHPDDAFYEDRDELIGTKISIYPNEITETDIAGYFGTVGRNSKTYYAVKLSPMPRKYLW